MGKLPGMSSVEIQALAVLGALKDAGYRLSELDGVINLNPYQSPACSRRLSQTQFNTGAETPPGGSSVVFALAHNILSAEDDAGKEH